MKKLNRLANATQIDNSVNLGLLLDFGVAFPEERPLTPEEYLRGGSRSIILNVAAFFLGFKSYNSKLNDNREFLGAIFGAENNGFANEIYDKIKAIEKTGKKVSIINTFCSLKLFECFFTTEEEDETQTHAEFERNLFKAYLVLNSSFISAQKSATTSTKEMDVELKAPMMLFCSFYPISDKTNYDIGQIWVTQLVKAIYLFQYLEANPRTEVLLKSFLDYFNSPTWPVYLKRLLPLTIPAIKNDREGHTDITVTSGDNFEDDCAFIEKLIVHDNDELEENDFLTIRAKPLYKIEEGVYRIIFNLFVVEKIFKGLYFLLRDVNDRLPKGQKIPGWKGIYCYEFSEQTLLYRIMDVIYPDKCIRFSGKELADKKIDGAPDYYVRKGNNIMVFESKDFLIRADLKVSFDYTIYDEEFAKTLYYEELPNGKEKAGAVMQLINSIRRLLRNEFLPDTEYYFKDVFIYPILITHDHQYDVPGLSSLINYWFQQELEVLKAEGFFIHQIKPLAVVNIDSLIYNSVGLTENTPLHEVLNAYFNSSKLRAGVKFRTVEEAREFRMSSFNPFSLFIDKYFKKQGIIKVPPILDLVGSALFKEEVEKS